MRSVKIALCFFEFLFHYICASSLPPFVKEYLAIGSNRALDFQFPCTRSKADI